MYKVMIVDDMEIIRRQIKRLPLWGEETGFHIVEEAEDGKDALDKLQKQSVDLLITDIKMPRIDGVELLKEVDEHQLARCVVFLSEHSEFSFAKEAIQYGIFDYLVKPVQREELQKLLLKAQQYIEEEREKESQLKKLEDRLSEKLEVYYPEHHIESIIQYISAGDAQQALPAIEAMVKDTGAALERDPIKTAVLLEKSYGEILKGIYQHHQWLDQFVDKALLVNINLTNCGDIEAMKVHIVAALGILEATIAQLILRGKKSPLIAEICSYVLENVEQSISISTISEVLFLTKNYIGDLFKQETGMTIGEYITMVKMERAKQLIAEGTLRNYEVADRLGYKDAEYFGKLFKKNVGLSPMEFKNALRDEARGR